VLPPEPPAPALLEFAPFAATPAAAARASTSRQSVYSSVSVGMFWRALRSSAGV
jgi:hypothetical protein